MEKKSFDVPLSSEEIEHQSMLSEERQPKEEAVELSLHVEKKECKDPPEIPTVSPRY